jgi:serine/threonine protein kinase
LAVESQLLTYLKHDNIVSLHAQGCLADAYVNGCRHFLLIDRLDKTLDEILNEWQSQDLPYFIPPVHSKRPSRVERIQQFALPIARAMEYLHSENVVFRDLKPHNIGTTADGTIKLFDFGLARIKDSERQMTGRVGSPLYMAPDYSNKQGYGLPVDVYSFSILLWELMTFKVPFDGMNRKELMQAVIFENRRPSVDETCGSQQVQELLSTGWIKEPHLRPTFSRIRHVLENEVGVHDEL